LKAGGKDIEVSDDNKNEYATLMSQYHTVTHFKEEFKSFLEGFHMAIPK
jgi:E3 ubiquitin-protein ligase NEDD4